MVKNGVIKKILSWFFFKQRSMLWLPFEQIIVTLLDFGVALLPATSRLLTGLGFFSRHKNMLKTPKNWSGILKTIWFFAPGTSSDFTFYLFICTNFKTARLCKILKRVKILTVWKASGTCSTCSLSNMELCWGCIGGKWKMLFYPWTACQAVTKNSKHIQRQNVSSWPHFLQILYKSVVTWNNV